MIFSIAMTEIEQANPRQGDSAHQAVSSTEYDENEASILPFAPVSKSRRPRAKVRRKKAVARAGTRMSRKTAKPSATTRARKSSSVVESSTRSARMGGAVSSRISKPASSRTRASISASGRARKTTASSRTRASTARRATTRRAASARKAA